MKLPRVVKSVFRKTDFEAMEAGNEVKVESDHGHASQGRSMLASARPVTGRRWRRGRARAPGLEG